MKTKINISFSYHSLDRFSTRLGVSMVETPIKMRELWKDAIEVDIKEVSRIVEDSGLKRKINKKTKFFMCDLFDGHKGIFVIRDNTCVTFKTTIEKYIWKQLNKK